MKRILLFALVLALLLTFVGCTGNGKDKSTNETETLASLAGKTESVPDAPSETKTETETETETPGSAVSGQQTDPPETSAAEPDTTRPGTNASSSTKQPVGHSETGSSEPGTTNSGKDNSGGTEPSGEHTGTNPAESGTTNTDNSGGVELPIDYLG